MATIKIGLDFHGVIDTNPEYFREFSSKARQRGWEIHVITGGPYKQVKAKLDNWQICYNKIFAIYDYYAAQHMVKNKEDGSFTIPSELWNSIKAKYCQENKISIQIDDSHEYGNSFLTPYCKFDNKERQCETLSGYHIDLKEDIERTLDEMEKFLITS